jgi:hypothetical protein
MIDSGIWIGPLIAVLLALWLRPTYLVVLGLTAFAAFVVSFGTAQSRYPDCGECPQGQHILSWFNGLSLTLAGALLLLGLAKHIFGTWRRHRAGADQSARDATAS